MRPPQTRPEFFGRSAGGQEFSTAELSPVPEASPSPSPAPDHPRRTYDTKTAGAYVTFGPAAGGAHGHAAPQFSAGVLTFDGPRRGGRLLTGAVRASSARYGPRADVGAGVFEGSLFDGTTVKGTAAAPDVSGFVNLRDDLTLQGQYVTRGRNFLHPQAGAGTPVNLASLGLTWKPHRRLTVSAAGTDSSRAETPGGRERLTTASVSYAPPRLLSNLFVSHTRNRTTHGGAASYTLLNATRDFRRWHLFVNASSIRSFGLTHRNAQAGASVRLGESGSLQMSHSLGSGGARGGSVDWWAQSFLSPRLSLGAGVGYSRAAGSGVKTYERVSGGARLPFEQTLQISYGHLQSGQQINFSLRGPLFSQRESRAELAATAKELNDYGSVSGRVYQDLNFNERYDPGVDRPQANVRVRVDGNLSAETDPEGLYRIARARAGEHTVALDLLSVRADLTILGGESRALVLRPGFDAAVDFRTVRTGRVAGTVWLDLNGNGTQVPDEPSLADVRVVTGGGRDTLTDEQGAYVIGDLPPGEHLLLVDLKTLPDNTLVRATLDASPSHEKDATGSLQVVVKAGAETGGVNFAVRPRPAAVKRF